MRSELASNCPPKPASARLFFALWPDPVVRAGLQRAAVESSWHFGGRAMKPETLHLTLAFLGDVPLAAIPRLEAAAAAVAGEAFCLTLDCLGYWGHNRLLWAGSQETVPALSRLVDCLAGQLQPLGYAPERAAGQAFAPHVTLVRKVLEKPRELPILPPLDWACEHFVLVRSRLSARGSVYETLGRWPLQ